MLGLLFGLLYGLIGGLEGEQISERQARTPNEGIQRSLLNGGVLLIAGLSIGLLFGLLGWLLNGQFEGLTFDLLFGLLGWLLNGQFEGLTFDLLFGLFFGLLAVFQHYILRILLWHAHLFPLKAVPFLEDATTRILLQRVGGGYSFTHRRLLDYFADLDPSLPPSPQP